MPSTTLRQNVLKKARRLVIKLGSAVLTSDDMTLDGRFMGRIAEQVVGLIDAGYDITLVSSGAIAMGRGMLEVGRRPRDVGALQALASVGQSGLMKRWHDVFAKRGVEVGQMLLSRDGFENRTRYLNVRNCIRHMHRLRVLPVVNENDAVAVEEIRFGDNDIIAALLASALEADALILLSTVDGLHDAEGNVVDLVEDFGQARRLVKSEKSGLGSGGMGTKLEAARMVTDCGQLALIANGREKDVLVRLLDGERIGTVFVPAARTLAPRQRWIVQAVRPAGTLTVDVGAARALISGGKSLLAIGITAVVGQFDRGDVILVRDAHGREVARGLINYNADETRAILGKKSSQIPSVLGRSGYDEVIHRDNMVVTAER